MDMNVIANMINTVGFPIVVSGALFWLNLQTSKTHKQEIDKITDALNNNTNAITTLINRLEVTKNEQDK